MVAQTQLRGSAPALKPQFERLDQSQQQGAVQELQVSQYPLPADVSVHRSADFIEVEGLVRRLTDIPTCEPEHLFEQVHVAPLSFCTHAQVVLDCAADHGLIELIRHPLPWHVGSHLCHPVGAAFGKRAECLSPEIPLLFSKLPETQPEILVLEGTEPVER